MISNNPKVNLTTCDCLIILVCSIPAFYLLGSPSIYIWDEAVYANASLEMSYGHSWWIPIQATYNTKPPLVLWLQAISYTCFPWPEFALRVPSALSVTGILVMLAISLKRWNFSMWTRGFVAVCFVGNEGFIRHHIARTGDLDAVMTFFVVGYSLIVLDLIHFKHWSKLHLNLFFCLVVAAFYSKSIAGWMMLGPLGIVWILSPMRTILWSKQFIIKGALSLVVCVFYYISRESIQTNFISLAWHSEYLRMFSDVMPWHRHEFSYYFKNFITLHTYFPWILFLMCAIGYSLFVLKENFPKKHLLRWIGLGIGYIVLISIPPDKLEWYDAPAYPFFALILGTVVGHLTNRIDILSKFALSPLILLIFIRKINFITHDVHPRHKFEYEGSILRQIKDIDSIKVFMPVETPEHRLQLDFYRISKQKQTGKKVEILESIEQVKLNDKLILNQDNLNFVESRYFLDTIGIWNGLGFEVKVKDLR